MVQSEIRKLIIWIVLLGRDTAARGYGFAVANLLLAMPISLDPLDRNLSRPQKWPRSQNQE